MRHFITAVLGSLTFAAALTAAENEVPRVAVVGTATTQVTPDQMVWRISAHNKGPKPSAVAEQHVKLVQRALSFLKERGIKASDVQTSEMTFGEYSENRNSSFVQEGYSASTQISFRTSDMAAYKPLWLGLAEIAGVRVNGVNYDHSKSITFQNATRRRALLAAKDKAADMAKTLGAEIAEPLLIEDDPLNDGDDPSNNVTTKGNEGGEQEALAPGTISIRARVKVVFRLIAHRG